MLTYKFHAAIGLLCCPAEVLRNQQLSDLLKLALADSLFFFGSRAEPFQPMAFIDGLVKANSKLSKLKSLAKYGFDLGAT
jgi:hypothetical protein